MNQSIKEELTEILKQVAALDDLHLIPDFNEHLESFESRLNDDEFRIAIVGEFSSGKSTFINAMIGKDVLQHASMETTATLTRVINVEKNDPRKMTGKVFLRSGNEIALQDLSKLKEFTTTQSETYNVVEQIRSVEIYLPIFDANDKIVLVDTPGLNGIAGGHMEQTFSLVQKAHICIYLIPHSGLTESNAKYLSLLAHYQKYFVFVQNFIDEIREQEETLDEKLDKQISILQQVFDGTDCVYSICGVSALKELASADKDIKRLYSSSKEDLTEEVRALLHQQSGFDNLRKLLNQMLDRDSIENIQYGGTAKAISDWLKQLLQQVEQRENKTRQYYESSREKDFVERQAARKVKILSQKDKRKAELDNFIVAKTDEAKKETVGDFNDVLIGVKRLIESEIDGKKNQSVLNEYRHTLPAHLTEIISSSLIEPNVQYQNRIKIIYQVLLERINKSTGIDCEDFVLPSQLMFNLPQNTECKDSDFERRLQQSEIKRVNKQNDINQLSAQIEKNNVELLHSMKDLNKIESGRRFLDKTKLNQLSDIGYRPEVQEKPEIYTDYEYRGGLGFIDWLCGPKQVEKTRIVQDDSAGKEWDNKKISIENEYAQRINQWERDKRSKEQRYNRLKGRQSDDQERLQKLEEELWQLDCQIKQEKETLTNIKKKAADEYLTSCKKTLKEQVDAIIEDTKKNASQTISNSIAREIQYLQKWANAHFEESVQQEIALIEQAQAERMPEILTRAEHLKETARVLSRLLSQLHTL